MKKNLFTIVVCFLPMISNAFNAIVDGMYYDLNSEKREATVISGIDYTTYMGRVVIPSSIEYEGVKYEVTAIGFNAFGSSVGLSEITIPESVISIGASAFGNARGLSKIIYLGSLESWCKISFGDDRSNGLFWSAFHASSDNYIFNCAGEEINGILSIPETVKSINSYSFCYLNVKQINLYNVENIGRAAFSGCKYLTDVYCYSKIVPKYDNYIFTDNMILTATLHVPAESIEIYKSDNIWGRFGSIVPIDDTGISIIKDNDEKIMNIYSTNGKLLNSVQKGVNIIRIKDGKTKKVMMK